MESLTSKIILLPLGLLLVFFVTLPIFFILLGSELQSLDKDHHSTVKIFIGIILLLIAICLHL